MKINSNICIFKEFEITSADVDMYGRLRPGTLLNYLIQSAIISADQLGFGFKNIKRQQLFWVLSRISIELYKPMKWYDKITVETWPKDSEKILYYRDYILRDDENNIIAKATSAQLAIDFISKKPKILNGINSEYFASLKDKKSLDYRPEKIDDFDGKIIAEKMVNFCDVDLNQHLTSTRYLDWIFDSFDVEFQKNNYPKKITINYIKETKLDESLEIIGNKFGGNMYLFKGENTQNHKTTFKSKIEF